MSVFSLETKKTTAAVKLPSFYQKEKPYADTVLMQPAVYLQPEYRFSDEVRGILYRGADYCGKETRVFAYLGIPKEASSEQPVPGVVLVHGGGHTADAYWVKRWVDRGYVAISMDLEGHFSHDNGSYCDAGTEPHAYSGPIRCGAFDDAAEPDITKQWPYQAVSAIMIARTLVGNLICVDDSKVGIMGFSWGGYLSSFTITVDNRYAFAIPVYGSAHLAESYLFREIVLAEEAKKWDPARNIGNITAKVLWFNRDNDFFTNLIGNTLSYEQTAGSQLLIDPNMLHGGGNCWARPEAFVFADSVVRGTAGLLRIVKEPVGRNAVCEVEVPNGVRVTEAKLFYRTPEMGIHNAECSSWLESPAYFAGNTVRGELPANAVAYYINVYDDRVLHDEFVNRDEKMGISTKVVYLVDTEVDKIVR